ncbi:Ni/Fe hydrogenase subunit alpha [Desulforhabdus amnigena]|jgi:F420-non-reducing hydrogenase large subunit|uniref:Methylviologen-reducing hydrogenase subunit alpha n=1 Tax=Desulforhabdus amnigena TaxID=40218 RepID=A0A9W6FTY9_9BACT|nr:Ni/Fe hydrogenase subunit alpha [Desulforhabdus amnigena]GLI34834.1 methylviologen-reducing hydrogenase subunit alpha [Desulforhabdus amnigena]
MVKKTPPGAEERSAEREGTRGGKVIHIQPVTRIEGHARISIHLDAEGDVQDARVHILSLRGFEKFIEGRLAEEVPRIVSRICGICPWQHHIASCKAVDGCFGANVPHAGRKLRELMQVMAHLSDKILHFFFLAAPDFVMGIGTEPAERNIMGMARRDPELTQKVVTARYRGQMMMEKFAGKVIHPVVVVPGGFAKPMLERERLDLLAESREQLKFARFAMDYVKEKVFSRFNDELLELGEVATGFLGTVNPHDGSLNLHEGVLRLMKPDGSFEEFAPEDYADFLEEHVESWSYGKFPYAAGWGEGFSMELEEPRGIYRVNSLARLNVCDSMGTPLAQAELEEFRSRFGRPAQSTLLYHWARMIELLYASEKTVELLEDPDITDPRVRDEVTPRAGRGIGCVEAPRGTLIHDYSTDENGRITRANLIAGTNHNLAPINMSVKKAAQSLIRKGNIEESLLNRVEMAVRAYDP